ncbi:MAG TPA: hypothetical protein VGI61_00680, partial [Parafilimonas sp.]
MKKIKNIAKHALLIVMFSCTAIITKAQTNFWNSSHAYLDQTSPSDTPKLFAPNMLIAANDTGFALDRIAFSKDGKEFYYCYNTSWFNIKNLKIKYFKFEDDTWKGPCVLNEKFQTPTFSVDGNSLYFPGGDSLSAVVWQSKKTDDGWSKPSVSLRTNYSVYNYMPTNSGNMYVGTNGTWGNRKDYSTYDIGVINIAGHDTTLTNLGKPINTDSVFDGDFFIAKDESYIIISTKETKDFECELYISFHKPDKTWTTPISLGPLINDGAAHRFGEYVTPDNKYLFYTRATSEKDCAIYW